MADAWNVRNSGELPNITVICKTGNVNQELVESLRRKLAVMSKLLARNPLWHEMNTMKAVIYKHHNQHRKEKYFKGAKWVHKHLSRLQEMDLEKILTTFINTLPKKGTPITTITRYPCYEAVEYVLLRFMGASKLAAQAIGHCKGTFNYVSSQLNHGFFITFHVVISAALSRVWVLLKDLIHNLIECYTAVYPWLDIVRQNISKGIESNQDVIPQCLKTWLNTDLDLEPPTMDTKNNNYKSAFTPKTSSLLDKMFSFTPQTGKQQDGSVSSQPRDMLHIEYKESPKNLLEGSVIVPRKMFQEPVSENSEATTVPLETTGKRKGGDLENDPECKRLFLDNDETSANTDEPCKERKSYVASANGETSRKQDIVFNPKTIDSTYHEQTEGNDVKRKRKCDFFGNNISEFEVDSKEVPKKRKKKKNKKESDVQVEVVIDNSDKTEENSRKKSKKYKKVKEERTNLDSKSNEMINSFEDDGSEVTKKRKKSKKKKKENEEETELQSNTHGSINDFLAESSEFNKEISGKKAKKSKKNEEKLELQTKDGSNSENELEIIEKQRQKKSKKVKKQNDEPIHIQQETQDSVNTETNKQRQKKSKKIKKQNDEPIHIQQETQDSINTETNSTKKKKKKKDKGGIDKSKKSGLSGLDMLALEQDSPKRNKSKTHKLSEQTSKTDKNTTKTTGNQKDYFDDLFSALGV